MSSTTDNLKKKFEKDNIRNKIDNLKEEQNEKEELLAKQDENQEEELTIEEEQLLSQSDADLTPEQIIKKKKLLEKKLRLEKKKENKLNNTLSSLVTSGEAQKGSYMIAIEQKKIKEQVQSKDFGYYQRGCRE